MLSRLRATTLSLFAQLFFIAAGVYIGGLGEDLREARSHREAARASLQNFRTEVVRNRAALTEVHAHHLSLYAAFDTVMSRAAPPKTIPEMFAALHWTGLHPASFRHAAWDLALGNQSLTYIDPTLAFAIADVYEDQATLDAYGNTTARNALNPAGLQMDNPRPLGMTILAYVTDASQYQEPELLAKYAKLVPRLDSAIVQLRN